MAGFAGFMSGLLGEVGGQYQRRTELQRSLDLARSEAELNFWNNLLQRPDLVPEARAEVMNRWFETLAATGDKKAAKTLSPARDFASRMLTTVYPGGEGREPIPGQTLEMARAEELPEAVRRVEIPPVPGIPERRGPFYTPQEAAQQRIALTAEEQGAIEAARRRASEPYRVAEDERTQRRMEEVERLRQAGRVKYGPLTQIPGQPFGTFGKLVMQTDGTPLLDELGEPVFLPSLPPADEQRKLAIADALVDRATGEGTTLTREQAYNRVALMPYELQESLLGQRAEGEKERQQRMREREERIKRGQLQRQRLEQLVTRGKQGLDKGGLRPSEARALLAQVSLEVRSRKAAFDPNDAITDLPFDQAFLTVAEEWGLTGDDITRLRGIAAGKTAEVPTGTTGPTQPGAGAGVATWEQYKKNRLKR